MIRPAGDQAVLVEFEKIVDTAIAMKILALEDWLKRYMPSGIREYVPGYSTLFILYDPLAFSFADMVTQIEQGLQEIAGENLLMRGKKLWIPVCYGGEFGPDLEDVAAYCGLSAQEVIEIHAEPNYFVHFTGFLPNFPFLGGLSRRIATPRLPKPRQQVPSGSVAIAGEQTGFYPIASPGGWRLIGRIPVCLYDLRRTNPFLIQPGDVLRFDPITPETYEELYLLDQREPYPFRTETVEPELTEEVDR